MRRHLRRRAVRGRDGRAGVLRRGRGAAHRCRARLGCEAGARKPREMSNKIHVHVRGRRLSRGEHSGPRRTTADGPSRGGAFGRGFPMRLVARVLTGGSAAPRGPRALAHRGSGQPRIEVRAHQTQRRVRRPGPLSPRRRAWRSAPHRGARPTPPPSWRSWKSCSAGPARSSRSVRSPASGLCW